MSSINVTIYETNMGIVKIEILPEDQASHLCDIATDLMSLAIEMQGEGVAAD